LAVGGHDRHDLPALDAGKAAQRNHRSEYQHIDGAAQSRREGLREQVHRQMPTLIGHRRSAKSDAPNYKKTEHLLGPSQWREEQVPADDVREIDRNRQQKDQADRDARDVPQEKTGDRI
jgi:hypothetical protein